jgi:glycosyltransferase involved in cell wall biosynthesis
MTIRQNTEYKGTEASPRLPRMLLIWSEMPSRRSGAAILMQRILKDYPEGELWLLTSAQAAALAADFEPVPAPKYHVYVPFRFIPSGGFLYVLDWITLLFIILRGVVLVYSKNIEAIFTLPVSKYLVAAYYVHRITHRPLYVYVMDDEISNLAPLSLQPTQQMVQTVQAGKRPAHWFSMARNSIIMANRVFFYAEKRLGRLIYAWHFPRILQAAKHVWSISVPMQEFLATTYRVESVLLHPFVDVAAIQRAALRSRAADDGEVRVIYSGNIYSGVQIGPLRTLATLINSAELQSRIGRTITLTLHTHASNQQLETLGLAGPYVRNGGFVHATEMPRILADADILFLPFSFDAGHRHFVATSFPAKTAEYMASGVPTLVHAPAYSSVARYCRQYESGRVVDEACPGKLADAIVELASNRALRQCLVHNAQQAARQNHDLRNIPAQFLELFVQ